MSWSWNEPPDTTPEPTDFEEYREFLLKRLPRYQHEDYGQLVSYCYENKVTVPDAEKLIKAAVASQEAALMQEMQHDFEQMAVERRLKVLGLLLTYTEAVVAVALGKRPTMHQLWHMKEFMKEVGKIMQERP